MAVLSLQRRMHPEIADLCRATSYPNLLVSILVLLEVYQLIVRKG
jgi:hypothetical protein